MELIRELTDEYSGYLRDESRNTGFAEGIAFPSNAQEIAEVIRSCAENHTKITVQGARTGLAAAAVPHGGVVLNLSKMNRVLGMRCENGTYFLRVQPGLSLLELRKMIASKRFDTAGWQDADIECLGQFMKDGEFFFSPDPTEATASIGGVISCNASGARTYMYGPTRPYVNSVTMILADGRTLTEKRGGVRADGLEAVFECDDGSKLSVRLPGYTMPDVKNASGYYVKSDMELIDLLIGSDGTLGVITEAEIILQPLPKFVWGLSLLFESEDASIGFTESIRGEKGFASLEFFDSDALDILRLQKKKAGAFGALPEIPENITNIIYAEIHAQSEEEALERLFTAGRIFAENGGKEENTWVARDESELGRLVFFRHAIPESVNMMIDEKRKSGLAITKMSSDMSVPAGMLRDAMRMYRETIAQNGLKSACWGHIGNDHVHFNILPDSEEQYLRSKEMFRGWAKWVSERGGAVSAEHGVGKIKADFLTIMYGEESIDEMRKVKRCFDPYWQLGDGNLFTEKEGI